MDNTAQVVEQIVRNLSFEVEAVPENVIEVTGTSRPAPLNVKIRVRKKDDPIYHQEIVTLANVRKANAGQKIRLVSSEQTIMSFSVIMDDKPIKNSQKPLFRSICLGTDASSHDFPYIASTFKENDGSVSSQSDGALKNRYSLSKMEKSSPTMGKKNKDIFGRCKPGGCLDPPFGEDFYPYETTKNIAPPIDNSKTQKTSSIFSHKLFKKRKSKSDSVSKSIKDDAILNLYQVESTHTTSTYSNSIFTYPSPAEGVEPRAQERKPSKTIDDSSFYIPTKKERQSLDDSKKEFVGKTISQTPTIATTTVPIAVEALSATEEIKESEKQKKSNKPSQEDIAQLNLVTEQKSTFDKDNLDAKSIPQIVDTSPIPGNIAVESKHIPEQIKSQTSTIPKESKQTVGMPDVISLKPDIVSLKLEQDMHETADEPQINVEPETQIGKTTPKGLKSKQQSQVRLIYDKEPIELLDEKLIMDKTLTIYPEHDTDKPEVQYDRSKPSLYKQEAAQKKSTDRHSQKEAKSVSNLRAMSHEDLDQEYPLQQTLFLPLVDSHEAVPKRSAEKQNQTENVRKTASENYDKEIQTRPFVDEFEDQYDLDEENYGVDNKGKYEDPSLKSPLSQKSREQNKGTPLSKSKENANQKRSQFKPMQEIDAKSKDSERIKKLESPFSSKSEKEINEQKYEDMVHTPLQFHDEVDLQSDIFSYDSAQTQLPSQKSFASKTGDRSIPNLDSMKQESQDNYDISYAKSSLSTKHKGPLQNEESRDKYYDETLRSKTQTPAVKSLQFAPENIQYDSKGPEYYSESEVPATGAVASDSIAKSLSRLGNAPESLADYEQLSKQIQPDQYSQIQSLGSRYDQNDDISKQSMTGKIPEPFTAVKSNETDRLSTHPISDKSKQESGMLLKDSFAQRPDDFMSTSTNKLQKPSTHTSSSNKAEKESLAAKVEEPMTYQSQHKELPGSKYHAGRGISADNSSIYEPETVIKKPHVPEELSESKISIDEIDIDIEQDQSRFTMLRKSSDLPRDFKAYMPMQPLKLSSSHFIDSQKPFSRRGNIEAIIVDDDNISKSDTQQPVAETTEDLHKIEGHKDKEPSAYSAKSSRYPLASDMKTESILPDTNLEQSPYLDNVDDMNQLQKDDGITLKSYQAPDYYNNAPDFYGNENISDIRSGYLTDISRSESRKDNLKLKSPQGLSIYDNSDLINTEKMLENDALSKSMYDTPDVRARSASMFSPELVQGSFDKVASSGIMYGKTNISPHSGSMLSPSVVIESISPSIHETSLVSPGIKEGSKVTSPLGLRSRESHDKDTLRSTPYTLQDQVSSDIPKDDIIEQDRYGTFGDVDGEDLLLTDTDAKLPTVIKTSTATKLEDKGLIDSKSYSLIESTFGSLYEVEPLITPTDGTDQQKLIVGDATITDDEKLNLKDGTSDILSPDLTKYDQEHTLSIPRYIETDKADYFDKVSRASSPIRYLQETLPNISADMILRQSFDNKSDISKNKLVQDMLSPRFDNESKDKISKQFDMQQVGSVDEFGVQQKLKAQKDIETSQQVPRRRTILKKDMPIIVDLGFRSFVNENNERIIKTFDGDLSNRYSNDTVVVAKCDMREPFELRIPTDTENYLCIKIDNNKTQSKSQLTIDDKLNQHTRNKLNLRDTGTSDDSLFRNLHKNRLKSHRDRQSEIMGDELQNALSKIYKTYERELLPLQDTIQELKKDVEFLTKQQLLYKETLMSKRVRRIRSVSTRRCSCMKKL